jgi:hypothetical protein
MKYYSLTQWKGFDSQAPITNKGKFIKIKDQSPSHTAFLQRAESLLASPPKKRTYIAQPSSTITYERMLHQNTTNTQSIAVNPHGTTTTTTTQTHQTFFSIMETRFQTIKHQVNNQ